VTAALVLLLTGCGGGSTAPPSGQPVGRASQGSSVSGDVVVLAAASLTGALDEVAALFEAASPGTRVVLSYGGSSALAQQVVAGAPADVFAAASPATMQTVVDAGDAAGEPVVFARNRLEIAVPVDDPGGIRGLADLADPRRTIALCAPEVPCGSAAEEAFAAAGLVGAPDTLEQDVKAVLSKVVLGEVDAGLVYRTDVLAAGDAVRGIAFPEAEDVVNDYPVVALASAPNAAAARAFAAFLRTPAAQEVLRDAGFDTA
jgi:molybdate transport system substrate-binding protein